MGKGAEFAISDKSARVELSRALSTADVNSRSALRAQKAFFLNSISAVAKSPACQADIAGSD
jgi:hypothetical protein